jgi:hypothetical protein
VRGRWQGAAAERNKESSGSKKEEEEECSRSAGEERGEARGQDGPIKVGRLRGQEAAQDGRGSE